MNYKIIAVEGISGSGKTTIVEQLSKRNGWQQLAELSDRYNPIEEFPAFSIINSEAIAANNWFLNKEVARCCQAREMLKHGNVIADRWYFSVFAVSYARNRIFGTDDGTQLDKEVEIYLNKGELFTPEVYIIDIPISIAEERIKTRYRGNETLIKQLNLERELLTEQRDYYINLARKNGYEVINGNSHIAIIIDYIICNNRRFELVNRDGLNV